MEIRDRGLDSLRGFVAVDDVQRQIVVAFRGSESLPEFIVADLLSAVQAPTILCPDCTTGLGYAAAYFAQRDTIMSGIARARMGTRATYNITVTGHSLGGALAHLAAVELRQNPLNAGIAIDLVSSFLNARCPLSILLANRYCSLDYLRLSSSRQQDLCQYTHQPSAGSGARHEPSCNTCGRFCTRSTSPDR
jgi:hypothetical protein